MNIWISDMPVTERDLSHEVKAYNNKTNSKTTTANNKASTSNSSSSSGRSPKKKQKTSNNNIQTLIKIDSKQPFDLSTSAFNVAAERCIQYNTTAASTATTHTNNTHSIDELVPAVHDNDLGHNSDLFESVHSSTGIVEPIRNSSSNNSCNDKASVE